MSIARLKLRQKLLLLLVTVGLVGISAFALIIALAVHQLFDRFVPENRALRDVEARSALLIQNYYRFMLTPDLIDTEILNADLVLIRRGLDNYRELVRRQQAKERLASSIGNAIDVLEQAGRNMVAARLRFKQIFSMERALVSEIDQAFERYQEQVSVDIGNSIARREWQRLVNDYLPELRMIMSLNQQYLQMFLQTREAYIEPGSDSDLRITMLKNQIKKSGTMLEIHEANSTDRAWMSTQLLVIYERLIDMIDTFDKSKQQAEFALSRAEQAGIDLNQAIGGAIQAAEVGGWRDLRESLYLASAILLLTLLISYLLIYAGLDRVLRPLEQLQGVITRLGKGDFKQRSSDVSRVDEIGQLAAAFNRMADQLEQNYEQKQGFIKQLEQKNMELERFTYTVSHELKSPLVTVNGFIGLLQRDLSADNREYIADDMLKISNAIETMSHQLEDLLELSRVGRVINPPTMFSVTVLCREVVQVMQGLIDERRARVEIEDEMPEICADKARIREVLKNLVESGIKFTPLDREPYIEIEAESRGDQLLCRLRDNGAGIEPRYQSRVFGLFDRLDNDVPGTGVGLALVKRIVEIHDGSIWIESQGDGQGSCFCFTLPVQRGS